MQTAVQKSVTVVEPVIRVIAAAVALSAVGTVLRMRMMSHEVRTFSDAWWIVRTGFFNSYMDMAVVWGAASVCLLFLLLTGRSQRLQAAIVRLFISFVIYCLLLACVNVVAVRFIGGSLTYQWIYYADLFHSFTARTVISPVLNYSALVMVGLLLLAWIAVFAASCRTLRMLDRSGLLRRALTLGVVVMAGYIVLATRRTDHSEDGEGFITNPSLEIVMTAMAAPATGFIETENAVAPTQLPPPLGSRALLPAGLDKAQIHNVVLVVMESVGARYVAGSGSEEAAGWTPRIASYRGSTLAFRNIYAHAPMSTKTLYSLLTSRYPTFSFEIETTKFASARMQTLSGRLKAAGLRTAFFMSGDLEFQYQGSFIEGKGFDLRADMRSIPCALPIYLDSSPEWPHLDLVDDRCTTEALTHWIDAQAGHPFFAMLWTGNTHVPYFNSTPPTEGSFSSDPKQNRYLGAVQLSDAAIGNVLDHLRQRGLLESTLVVVIGDHGEAFGEHGRRAHGTDIFEEQTHVPLLLINQQISTPEPNNTLGGMIDIAPTILHVLGLAPELTWEGRSVFDPNRPGRVYMFAPNLDMVAGYRQDHQKFMYRLSRDKASVYDLANDPGETRNLADGESARAIRSILSGWLRDQERRNKELRTASR